MISPYLNTRTTSPLLLAVAGELGKDLLISYIDGKTNGHFADLADKTIESGAHAFGKNMKKKELNFTQEDYLIDPVKGIQNLRKQFSECVETALKEQKKDRVVIFVDDLDRLEPKKAVELLEVMKNFFDCKDCVFVLAIDYDVVCRGVAEKYNYLNSNDNKLIDKGRSFFDKIIQVPFKMPVAKYQIQKYVKHCFETINFSVTDSELLTYERLIRLSIGTNPRAMKRLFNSFQLLTIVVPTLKQGH